MVDGGDRHDSAPDDPHERCARLVLESIRSTRSERGEIHLAWCGGASARAVLSSVADGDLSDTHWYPTDERCLPVGHPERNDRLFQELLVDSGSVPAERIHSIPAELGPHDGAAAYDRLLRGYPEFDVAFLSLAPDGHVASLFPGHPALEAMGCAVGVTNSPKPPAQRVSLTVGRLGSSRVRIVVAVGAEKAEAARTAIEEAQGPAALVRPTHWFLDRADVLR